MQRKAAKRLACFLPSCWMEGEKKKKKTLPKNVKPQALSHIDGSVVKILGLCSENFKGGILHKEVSR